MYRSSTRASTTVRQLVTVVIALLVFSPPFSLAAEDTTDEHQKNLLIAIQAVQLTEEQKAPFGKVIQSFFEDIQRVIRKEYERNHPRMAERLKKKITKLYEELDGPAMEILRDDQWFAFQNYKYVPSQFLKDREYRFSN